MAGLISYLIGRAGPLAALVATLWLGALPAAAVPVTELVAERAGQEFGAALPASGYFDVRLSGDGIRDGHYIQEFWIDDRSGKFIANVVTEAGDTHRVWGVATLTVPVPIPVLRKLPEEIVTEADVQIVAMPWARLGAFAITDAKDLIGMQVRRMLVPGRPVPRQSVIPPIVIARGDRVTIELTYGALRLEAKGRAVNDAHLGQEVRVVNLSSKKTITATAKASGLVEVYQ
ncbi:flagellar basal body P-ring formation chaperone FlgA [Shimia sp.]|uniref:flagellar basal body P-ring formation chaperone FlgA n=1 Tax=Shimia sp. TaxID=1954381 RepID=UPI003563F178